MEELRSTEALDKEILEDARKKANRLLRTADDTVKNSSAEWAKKTEDAVADIRKSYAEHTRRSGSEIMARLPLDKRRARSEFMEKELSLAMEEFLSSLSRRELLSLLEGELRKRSAEVPDEELRVSYRLLDGNEADKILSSCLPGKTWKAVPADMGQMPGGSSPPADSPGGNFPELVIDSPRVRIFASVNAAAADLLQDKRAELAEALFGKEALDD